MKLTKRSIKGKSIKKQTYEEWFFFYVSNWFLAETRTLKMLYLQSMNRKDADGVELFGRNYRTMLLGCLLASKLWEGWEMLHNSYFGTTMHNDYRSNYGASVISELGKIKAYFAKKDTILYKLRNSTFHYPTDKNDKIEFKKYFESYSNDETDSFYFIADTFEQSMFSIDHFIANFVSKTESMTVAEGIKKLHTECLQIMRSFNIFLSKYIEVFSSKSQTATEEIFLKNVPKRLDINIPFFSK